MQHKLIIGTANFGLVYGIAHQQLSITTIGTILAGIQEYHLWGIDTAFSYGAAEEHIGHHLQGQKPFKIITKLPHKYYPDETSILQTFNTSLMRLGIEHVDYLLCHSFATYRYHQKLLTTAMKELQSQGKIKQWGVSVYSPAEVQAIAQDGYKNLVIEFPINLLDQRFVDYLDEFKRKQYVLLARSVFLQGLFFLNSQELAEQHILAKKPVRNIQDMAENQNMTVAELALRYVVHFPQLDGIVLGVNSLSQLQELVQIINKPALNSSCYDQITSWAIQDEQIILPQNWKSPHA